MYTAFTKPAVDHQLLHSVAALNHVPGLMTDLPADTDDRLLVQSFGTLRLSRGGERIQVRGKGRALLVELLARGGDDVCAARVANALWPHGELDYAMGALNTTLYRLRKVPGLEDAITLNDGRIGFDPDTCIVDQWVLQAALDAATTLLECGSGFEAPEVLPKLLGVVVSSYRGPLLAQEDLDAATTRRDHLRARTRQTLAHADAVDVPVSPGAQSWTARFDVLHPLQERAHLYARH